jgi:hypothetical protein
LHARFQINKRTETTPSHPPEKNKIQTSDDGHNLGDRVEQRIQHELSDGAFGELRQIEPNKNGGTEHASTGNNNCH